MERSHAKGWQAEIPTTRDDPAIGRWGSVDPMVEKYPGYSPYNYVLNNPISKVDPDGKLVFTAVAASVIVGLTELGISVWVTVEVYNAATNGGLYNERVKRSNNRNYGKERKNAKVRNKKTQRKEEKRYSKSLKQQPPSSPDPSEGKNDNDPTNPRFKNAGKSGAATLTLLQLMSDGYSFIDAIKKIQEDQKKKQEQAEKEKNRDNQKDNSKIEEDKYGEN